LRRIGFGDKLKLVMIVYVVIGLLLSLGGLLMVIYFNMYAVTYPNLQRLLGFIGGLVILFIGFHIFIVGLSSLRSTK